MDVHGALPVGERAESSTGRAGLLVGQGVGLPLQQALQGAFDQAGGGVLGDALQGRDIEVDGVVASAASDDFAPLGGEVVQLLQFGGGKVRAWHGASCLGVATSGQERLPRLSIFTHRTRGKAVHGLQQSFLKTRNSRSWSNTR